MGISLLKQTKEYFTSQLVTYEAFKPQGIALVAEEGENSVQSGFINSFLEFMHVQETLYTRGAALLFLDFIDPNDREAQTSSKPIVQLWKIIEKVESDQPTEDDETTKSVIELYKANSQTINLEAAPNEPQQPYKIALAIMGQTNLTKALNLIYDKNKKEMWKVPTRKAMNLLFGNIVSGTVELLYHVAALIGNLAKVIFYGLTPFTKARRSRFILSVADMISNVNQIIRNAIKITPLFGHLFANLYDTAQFEIVGHSSRLRSISEFVSSHREKV